MPFLNGEVFLQIFGRGNPCGCPKQQANRRATASVAPTIRTLRNLRRAAPDSIRAADVGTLQSRNFDFGTGNLQTQKRTELQP
jgi:hypothetical protein